MNPLAEHCRLLRGLFSRLAILTLTALAVTLPPRCAHAAPEIRIISVSGDLNFGNVLIGSSAQRTMKISNLGNSPLTVSGIYGPAQPVLLLGGYSTDWNLSATIAPGRSQEVPVTFAPGGIAVLNNTNPVDYPAALTVVSDATSGTGTIQVSGVGIVQQNSASPIISVATNLNFGQTKIDSVKSFVLVIANKGASDLTISNINFPEGFNAWEFSGFFGSTFTNTTIPPGGETNIFVLFTPTNAMHYGGTATIVSDATGGRSEFAVSGEGVYPTGHYIGLFGPGLELFSGGTNAAFDNSGYFSGNVAASGGFSGMLLLAGARCPFSGRFSSSGAFSGSIPLEQGGSLGVSFQVTAGGWYGVISNQNWSADLFANPAIVSSNFLKPPGELAPNTYGIKIAGSPDPLLAPTNYGVGTIQLAPSRAARIRGKLGDGTAFSQDTVLCEVTRLPFYASLYQRRGAVLGWLLCEVVPTNFPPIIPPLTNREPFTNFPPVTNTVPLTNIPPILITNFLPFTNSLPITNIAPVLLSSRITLDPADLSGAGTVPAASAGFSGTNRISGSINWFKPPQIDSNYPGGFSFQTTVNGPTD